MNKKIVLMLIGILLPVITWGQTAMDQYAQLSNQCTDLRCTTENIDAIDSQIVTLIGERFAFAQRAGELGGGTYSPPASVSAALQDKFDKIGIEAATVGYSPIAARSIFSMILFQSNLVEQNAR